MKNTLALTIALACSTALPAQANPLLRLFAIQKLANPELSNREALRRAAVGTVANRATSGVANPLARAVVAGAVRARLDGRPFGSAEARNTLRGAAISQVARQATAGIEDPLLRKLTTTAVRRRLEGAGAKPPELARTAPTRTAAQLPAGVRDVPLKDLSKRDLNIALQDLAKTLGTSIGQALRAARQQPPKPAVRPGARVDTRIDINQATAKQLRRLPGIGKVRAAQIINSRPKNGYRAFTDLRRLPGFTPKVVNKLRGRAVARRR